MIPIPAHCIEIHQKPLFPLSEDGCRLPIENPHRYKVEQIQIDHCTIQDPDTMKCDYLLNVEATDASYLIELKGSKWKDAYGQIETTYALVKDGMRKRRVWLICTSGTVNIPLNDQVKMSREARKKGAELQFTRHKRPYSL